MNVLCVCFLCFFYVRRIIVNVSADRIFARLNLFNSVLELESAIMCIEGRKKSLALHGQ